MIFNFNPEHTFFTSDTHFNHANIIKFCDRPFKDVELMNETLIANWNRVVGLDDTVFHLGDFCLGGAGDQGTVFGYALKADTGRFGSSSDMSTHERTTRDWMPRGCSTCTLRSTMSG